MCVQRLPPTLIPKTINTFDDDGYPNCGWQTSIPCIGWQEANYTSTSLYFYIDPSLSTGYNYLPAIQRAFNDFNSAPAWNPYMYMRVGGGSYVGTYSATSDPHSVFLDCWNYGGTWRVYQIPGQGPGSVAHLSSQYPSDWGSYIVSTTVIMNSQITWNTNLQFSQIDYTCPSDMTADVYKAVTHETGHVVGLGHSNNVAVMVSGGYRVIDSNGDTQPVTWNSLQPDDKNGLIDIYPGTGPTNW